jgi:hypothetical protein
MKPALLTLLGCLIFLGLFGALFGLAAEIDAFIAFFLFAIPTAYLALLWWFGAAAWTLVLLALLFLVMSVSGARNWSVRRNSGNNRRRRSYEKGRHF